VTPDLDLSHFKLKVDKPVILARETFTCANLDFYFWPSNARTELTDGQTDGPTRRAMWPMWGGRILTCCVSRDQIGFSSKASWEPAYQNCLAVQRRTIIKDEKRLADIESKTAIIGVDANCCSKIILMPVRPHFGWHVYC